MQTSLINFFSNINFVFSFTTLKMVGTNLDTKVFYIILSLTLIMCSPQNVEKHLKFTEMTVVSGGGATGFWSGFKIDSLGNLYQLSGFSVNLKDSLLRQLKQSDLKKIERIIIDNKLESMNYQLPGNISRKITILTESKQNIIIWNPFAESEEAKKLDFVFDKIIGLLKEQRRQE